MSNKSESKTHTHVPVSECQTTARQWCVCGAWRKQIDFKSYSKRYSWQWSEWFEPEPIKQSDGETA